MATMTSPINCFPGYSFENGKNMYRGEDLGKGGWVYGEPGEYYDVALLDVGNMHGASILALNKFGEYTKNYRDIREARMAIKHREFDKARKMFGGKLAKYLNNTEEADQLQAALKLVLNSTYGIAAATFDNPLRDPRDKNNIIALRGALFMRTLKDELIAKGYPGIHYKTDSVKIPHATPEIIEFVMNFGKKYGYEFEHEATYEKMCLVNDAVYIAKYMDPEKCEKKYGYIPGDNKKHFKEHGGWTATGTQFQIPYVFKYLFSKEPIEFKDMCETKTVTSALYLDMNESLPDVSAAEKELDKVCKEIGKQAAATYDIQLLPKLTADDLKAASPELWRKKEALEAEVAKGHNYIFVGRAGSFCPIKPGRGGGLLMREKDGKYSAATGTKGYRWKESETVKTMGLEDDIDTGYFRALVDDAIAAINEYGDFDSFVSDKEQWIDITSDELPF